MTLETAFQQHFQSLGWADTQQRGLVAVSTGVDSMVLLNLLLQLPKAQRPQLTVVHVNHQLRAQSTAEAAFLQEWCRSRGVPLVIKAWPKQQHPQHGIEAAARDFRYNFFAEQLIAQQADWVATAHQADEQAETLLLKLVRGGELAQLAGMQANRSLGERRVIHPLLPFTKAQLVTYARTHQIPWYEDATNQELVASRNRIRHEILPALQRENPQVVEHVNDYAWQLQATLAVAERTLDHQLEAIVIDQVPLTGRCDRLLYYSEQEQVLLLARLIKQVAPSESTRRALIQSCLQLLKNTKRPTGRIMFRQGWVLCKSYNTFQFLQPKKLKEKSVEHFSFMVDLNQWRSVGNGWKIGLLTASRLQEQTPHETVALTTAQLPLTVRSWQASDALRLATGHHQTVRRVLINAKVPPEQRPRQAVLVAATGEILAVLGVKWSVWPSRPHTKNYHIVWKHE